MRAETLMKICNIYHITSLFFLIYTFFFFSNHILHLGVLFFFLTESEHKEKWLGIQWEAIKLLCLSSSPKQTGMSHKTKRQQVHAGDANPSNDTPITSNSTHPNSL